MYDNAESWVRITNIVHICKKKKEEFPQVVIATVTCPMRFISYPFDRHSCPFLFGRWSWWWWWWWWCSRSIIGFHVPSSSAATPTSTPSWSSTQTCPSSPREIFLFVQFLLNVSPKITPIPKSFAMAWNNSKCRKRIIYFVTSPSWGVILRSMTQIHSFGTPPPLSICSKNT